MIKDAYEGSKVWKAKVAAIEEIKKAMADAGYPLNDSEVRKLRDVAIIGTVCEDSQVLEAMFSTMTHIRN